MKVRPSLLVETGARTMVPTLLVVSAFLLVVGHDSPGGGFVGGLLAGGALLVVFLSGGRAAVTSMLPVPAGAILGAGIMTAVATAIGGLVFGRALLDAGKLEIDAGWFGSWSVGSALLFDVGVFLVVVGLVSTVLLQLGDPEEREE
ncbi:MAG: hypothetical protein KJP12_05165 [Acidimicrobiia bacterium]|nr:hypothetical protein [Acidimicrobiia bacterium]MBT8214596.1 hypothetical protein [Acidimicrobiia bacterium]NNF69343.1 hypothetical protein [Acidimicrobiia bacterium]